MDRKDEGDDFDIKDVLDGVKVILDCIVVKEMSVKGKKNKVLK